MSHAPDHVVADDTREHEHGVVLNKILGALAPTSNVSPRMAAANMYLPTPLSSGSFIVTGAAAVVPGLGLSGCGIFSGGQWVLPLA